MPVSSHQDSIEPSRDVKRRRGLANCFNCASAGILIACGLAVAGAELLFHGLNRSLGGCALATGLLLVATGIVAIATRGRPSIGVALRFAVPLLCLASLPACIATAFLAFTASESNRPLPWCDVVRLPQGGNSTLQLNLTSPAAAAAAPSHLPPEDAIEKSAADVFKSGAIFWSRLGLIVLLCASVAASVFLMSASLAGICRVVKASRRRHIRPSSLIKSGGGGGDNKSSASKAAAAVSAVSCDSTSLGLLS